MIFAIHYNERPDLPPPQPQPGEHPADRFLRRNGAGIFRLSVCALSENGWKTYHRTLPVGTTLDMARQAFLAFKARLTEDPSSIRNALNFADDRTLAEIEIANGRRIEYKNRRKF